MRSCVFYDEKYVLHYNIIIGYHEVAVCMMLVMPRLQDEVPLAVRIKLVVVFGIPRR
jgi:hypothetical protein